jgi:molecular chaperone GrpE
MPSSRASEEGPQAPEQQRPDAPQGEAPAEQQQQAQPEGQRSEQDERYAQLEDRYKRALADLDNLRKRTARELDRRVAESRDAMVRDWLDAVDAIERALRMDATNPLAEGLRAVLEQMESILARHGVQRIGTAGERFDPERHEAVAVTENDELPDQTIVEVARSGFAVGDRVVRPAQVVVSRRDGRGA